MQLLIEEGGVQQNLFKIHNNDRTPWHVSLSIPKILGKYVNVTPKKQLIQNGMFISVCVRVNLTYVIN